MQTATTAHNNLKQCGLKSAEGIFNPSEDRPILYSHSARCVNPISDRQKPCFEFHACNKPAQISADTHKHMDADILYAFHSQVFKAMAALQDTEEPLNRSSHFIDALETLACSDSLHNILNPVVFLEIESRAIFALVTILLKQATISSICMKSAAELDSFSQSLLAPVAEFDACLAEELPIGAYRYISPVNGILPASWICGNKGSDIAAYQIRGVISAVIASICKQGINVFAVIGYDSSRLIGQLRQKLAVPFIAGRDFYGSRHRKFCIGNFNMNLISEKGEVLAFITPSRLIIGFESLDVRGINGELQSPCLNKTEALGNEIDQNFIENIFSESFSEIMESIVFGSFTVRETAEVSQSSIETELLGEVSFRASKTEIDEKKGFKEGLRVVSFAPFIAVTVFDQAVNEGEIYRAKENLQGVVRRNDRGDFKVNETELFRCSHLKASIWN